MTVNIIKDRAFRQDRTTTAAVANSALVVELLEFAWEKPALSRNAKKNNEEEIKEIEPSNEETK